MRQNEKVKQAIVKGWLNKAEQDIKAGEALLDLQPQLLYPACFHAQQAAEKYLKALLTWHQVEFPKTHAIELLLKLLEEVDPKTANALKEAENLTPYGVELRYPGDQPEPDLTESLQAISISRKVQEIVLKVLSKNINF